MCATHVGTGPVGVSVTDTPAPRADKSLQKWQLRSLPSSLRVLGQEKAGRWGMCLWGAGESGVPVGPYLVQGSESIFIAQIS